LAIPRCSIVKSRSFSFAAFFTMAPILAVVLVVGDLADLAVSSADSARTGWRLSLVKRTLRRDGKAKRSYDFNPLPIARAIPRPKLKASARRDSKGISPSLKSGTRRECANSARVAGSDRIRVNSLCSPSTKALRSTIGISGKTSRSISTRIRLIPTLAFPPQRAGVRFFGLRGLRPGQCVAFRPAFHFPPLLPGKQRSGRCCECCPRRC